MEIFIIILKLSAVLISAVYLLVNLAVALFSKPGKAREDSRKVFFIIIFILPVFMSIITGVVFAIFFLISSVFSKDYILDRFGVKDRVEGLERIIDNFIII